MAQRSETRSEAEKLPGNGGNGTANGANGEAKGPSLERPQRYRHPSGHAAVAPWRSYKEQIATLAQAHRRRAAADPRAAGPSLGPVGRGGVPPRAVPRAAAGRRRTTTRRSSSASSPSAKIEEFEEIARASRRELGEKDAIGRILVSTAARVPRRRPHARARAARTSSTRIRASSTARRKDKFPDGKTSVRDLGHRALRDRSPPSSSGDLGPKQPSDIDAPKPPPRLNQRFATYFRRRRHPGRRSTTRCSPTPRRAATT